MKYVGNQCYIFPAKSKNTVHTEYHVNLKERHCDCDDFLFRKDARQHIGYDLECKHLKMARMDYKERELNEAK